MRTQAEKKPPSLEKAESLDNLISIEWDVIKDLKKMLRNPELSVAEKVHVSNSIAYHVACLNKLLAQKGESPVSDATLGTFIRDLEPRYARRVTLELKRWTRRLSLTR